MQKYESGASTRKANDIVLTVINDGSGSQCGLGYAGRRTATLSRLREACRHYAPTAKASDIREAADLIKEYYESEAAK